MEKYDESVNLVTSMKDTLEKIFNLNSDNTELEESLKYCFKILLFDDKVFNILSPLLKIYYLREFNISLTMNIKDSREKMPDIMAIYIITPTKENFNTLFEDIKNQIFDNFYINFISFDNSNNKMTSLLNEFYQKVSNLENCDSIFNISIIPIDISLYHPKIFSFNIKKPYLLLNTPNASDEFYQNYISSVSYGLFSLLYLMKSYPIVKYHNGFFGDDIIKRIQSHFNYLFEKVPECKEKFSIVKNNQHTLLLILDRDIDLPIMLHHACSFGAMINDHIGINNSQFELDPVNDYIWNTKLHEVFIDVGEYIFKEYKKFYKDMDYLDKVSRPKDIEQLQDESQQLAKSIESLRDKKIIGNILSQLSKVYENLSNIQKNKKLDQIFSMECNLLKKREKITENLKNEFYKLIKYYKEEKDEETKDDIYRICLLYYLCNSKNISKNELNNLDEYILNKDSINYLKKKIEENYLRDPNKKFNQNNNGMMSGIFSAFNTISSYAVSSLMTIEQPSVSADLVYKLVKNQNIQNWNTYSFHKKSVEKEMKNYNYNNVICFFVGGGSLGEYEYIYDLLSQYNYNIYYGADCIYRPSEFLQNLEELGKITNS